MLYIPTPPTGQRREFDYPGYFDKPDKVDKPLVGLRYITVASSAIEGGARSQKGVKRRDPTIEINKKAISKIKKTREPCGLRVNPSFWRVEETGTTISARKVLVCFQFLIPVIQAADIRRQRKARRGLAEAGRVSFPFGIDFYDAAEFCTTIGAASLCSAP
ncbi:hypothetical protein [Lacisediminimonas sp.]|uniref:hypothetical protein n=1 Tax=Lacisediminimonas sp. TaxID=3060582 RepID=UPI002722AC53|nr:hypothetical protein [Lacisediminimonas sp.]MDO8301116.1 hypothetical protein [Lacisediminimonas sp.]